MPWLKWSRQLFVMSSSRCSFLGEKAIDVIDCLLRRRFLCYWYDLIDAFRIYHSPKVLNWRLHPETSVHVWSVIIFVYRGFGDFADSDILFVAIVLLFYVINHIITNHNVRLRPNIWAIYTKKNDRRRWEWVLATLGKILFITLKSKCIKLGLQINVSFTET